VAIQIASSVNQQAGKRSTLLITGGGAYNEFLVSRIGAHVKSRIVLPDDRTIQFKEAAAFALLGLLRLRKEINILKSVTGAKRNSSGGKLYLPG
jgi:anhydro-N-acetylmuramic acid kinase